MTYLLTYEPKPNKNKIQTRNRIEKTMKNQYIRPHQRKQLSRYKLKKQVTLIEKILSDPQLVN